jgi:hypothetical protein
VGDETTELTGAGASGAGDGKGKRRWPWPAVGRVSAAVTRCVLNASNLPPAPERLSQNVRPSVTEITNPLQTAEVDAAVAAATAGDTGVGGSAGGGGAGDADAKADDMGVASAFSIATSGTGKSAATSRMVTNVHVHSSAHGADAAGSSAGGASGTGTDGLDSACETAGWEGARNAADPSLASTCAQRRVCWGGQPRPQHGTWVAGCCRRRCGRTVACWARRVAVSPFPSGRPARRVCVWRRPPHHLDSCRAQCPTRCSQRLLLVEVPRQGCRSRRPHRLPATMQRPRHQQAPRGMVAETRLHRFDTGNVGH